MNYYPFNSRNSLYKSHFGAIASGESQTLRLLLHKDAAVYEAYLIIYRDGESQKEIKLTEKEWLEDYRFYDTEIALSEGLYGYYFRYTSANGDFFVIKDKGGNGIFSKENGAHFQQTVYDADFKTPSHLEGGLIYQIFPDRFNNSKTPKKNVPTDRFLYSNPERTPQYIQRNEPDTLGNDYFGGDLKGITEKLDYIKSLGVTLIYLNPVFEAHSNHRYNTADYMKIDPLLGEEKDFTELCKKAKSLGIGIIIDGVFSHTGSDSIYFNKENRYKGDGAYNNPDSPYRSWYKFDRSELGYHAWWGVPSLPEINETDAGYLEFITGKGGVVEHWLKAGACGIRLDVADELPDAFLCALRNRVKKTDKNAFVLGEVWEDASNKISYGQRREYLLGHQLDSVMNYPFYSGIIDFVRFKDAEKLCETVLTVCENYPKQSLDLLMNHLGTHDTMRALTSLSKDDNYCGDREWQSKQKLDSESYTFAKRRLMAAAVLQYTLPGIPSLFYGDEAGTEGYGDPFCRAVYPWGKEDKTLLEFYKALGDMRSRSPALKSGQFEPFYMSDGLFCFVRKNKNGGVFVAVNAGGNKTVCIPKDFEKPDITFGKPTEGLNLSLCEYEYCILSYKK